MALDERSRHELYLRLEETLGPEAATTLMEHLPPVGWADVATKRDVDQSAALLRNDLALLRLELDHLRLELDHLTDRLIGAVHGEILPHVAGQNRTMAFTVIGTILATATLALTAAHFF
jgi:hypothetical protein